MRRSNSAGEAVTPEDTLTGEEAAAAGTQTYDNIPWEPIEGAEVVTGELIREDVDVSDTGEDTGAADTDSVIEVIPEEEATEAVPEGSTYAAEAEIETVLSTMTTEEKVAQLFFVTPESITGVEQVTRCGDTMRSALQSCPVGGIVLFAQNLISPEQTKEMLSGMQDAVGSQGQIPLFLGVDEEGGRVARVASNAAFGVTKVRPMKEIGATGDIGEAYRAGNTIGLYLRALGFNTDFAPDTDVLTNASNTVIGNRSFGSDPALVKEMAAAYASGLQDGGVYATYKHFPGHGGTAEDTHEGYAYSYKTLEELKEAEMVPFQDAGEHAAFLMVSHISLPNVLGDNTPASLSKTLITDLLREEMGYDGIIITDALGMGAVSEHYSSAQASLLAFQAGCDMLLMPKDYASAYQALLGAVQSGEISMERLDASVRRILRVKLNMETE